MTLEEEGALKKRVQKLFGELGGGVTMRVLAQAAIDRGFWDEAQLDGATVAWATKRVRDMCGEKDERGLPFAVAVCKGRSPTWRQIELIDSTEEANFVIQERVTQVASDHAELETIHRYFVRRFGGGISSIPRLI